MNDIRKLISISGYNHTRSKRLRMAGNSFNKVITSIFAGLKEDEINNGLLHGKSGFGPRLTSVAILKPNLNKSGELNIA